MVEIEYLGGNGLKIVESGKTIILDPKRSVVGLRDVVTKDFIEIVTEPALASSAKDTFLTIDGPGEYEVADFSVRGFAADRHTDFNGEMSAVNYTIETQDATIGIIGNINDNLSESQLEDLGVIDILVIPIGGGGYTLDGKMAAKIIKDIEPKLVIPIHFNDDRLQYPVIQDSFDE